MEIACIVEGQGEEEALPVLLRRIIEDIDPQIAWTLQLHTPIRRGKDLLKQRDQLVRVVELAVRQLVGPGGVLVLLDADDDCPAELGPRLLGWAREARSDVPIAVVVANREYEAWFLAAAESLRGYRGLAADLSPPLNSEAVRGAKQWLASHMPVGQPYSPTRHQASFSQKIDLSQARRASSFDKFCRDVRSLVDALHGPVS